MIVHLMVWLLVDCFKTTSELARIALLVEESDSWAYETYVLTTSVNEDLQLHLSTHHLCKAQHA